MPIVKDARHTMDIERSPKHTENFMHRQKLQQTTECHLLIIFANSLDPDQAQHVRPDLDPNYLTLKRIFQRLILEKKNQQSTEISPSRQRVNPLPHRRLLNVLANRADPDQGLLCLLLKYDISDPTQLDLINKFCVLCTNMKVYLYNYS